ncbi:MAG: lysophospholipid acyltransferase family protein [Burkholderiaceae bacterium]
MRFVLAPLRAAALLVHVVVGLALVILAFPFLRQATRNRIIHIWSRGVVRLFGARLIVTGMPMSDAMRVTGIEPGSRGRLVLANHVSWIDVFAINAATPCRFVAKDEIGRWPVLGALVTRSGTLYIERGRRHAVAAMNHTVRDRLLAGESVAVFPEGTTTDGRQLLPFHSNLVAPAIAAAAPVWPIAIVYREGDRRSDAAAFIGEMTLVTSMIRILVAREMSIEIAVLAPIDASQYSNRHAVARSARDAIAAYLGVDEAEAVGVLTT